MRSTLHHRTGTILLLGDTTSLSLAPIELSLHRRRFTLAAAPTLDGEVDEATHAALVVSRFRDGELLEFVTRAQRSNIGIAIVVMYQVSITMAIRLHRANVVTCVWQDHDDELAQVIDHVLTPAGWRSLEWTKRATVEQAVAGMGVAGAARALGLHRFTLQRMIKKFPPSP